MPTSTKDLVLRAPLAIAQDSFQRGNISPSSSVATGWGTASDSETWTAALSGGSPSYAITSNEGTLTGTTSTCVLYLGSQTLPGPGSSVGSECLVRFAVTSLSDEISVVLSGNSAGTTYYRYRYKTSASNLIRVNSGTSTTLASQNVSLTVNTFYWLKVRVTQGAGSGNVLLLGKFWAASSTEPVAWTLSVLDTSASALTGGGRYGVSVKLNATTDTVSFDSFQAQGAGLPAGKDLTTRTNVGLQVTKDLLTRERIATLQTQDLTWRLVFGYPTVWKDASLRIKPAPTLLKDALLRTVLVSSLQDTFSRANTTPTTSITSGWGTSSDGESWAQATTGSPTYAISGNEGTLTGTTSAEVLYLGLTSPGIAEGLVRFTATGSSDDVSLILRGDSTGQSYYRMRYKTSSINLIRVNAGLGTTLASQNVSFTTGTFYWLRFRLILAAGGSPHLLGKYWKDGTSEPTSFALSVTDASSSALIGGQVGLFAKLNATTDTVSFDSFQVTVPGPLSVRDLSLRSRIAPAHAPDLLTRALLAASPQRDLVWRLVFGYPVVLRDLTTRIRIAPTVLKDASLRMLPISALSDTFQRANTTPSTSVTSGWGTSSDGESWAQATTGTLWTYAVTGNEGTITGSTSTVVAYLGLQNLLQTDLKVRFAVTAITDEVSLVVRGDAQGKNYYRVRYKSSASNIIRVNNSVSTTLASANVSLSTGTFYWLRFRVVEATGPGTVLLLGKFWKDGTSEPTGWTMNVQDGAASALLTGGRFGLSTKLNGAADTVSFDHVQGSVPQDAVGRDLSTRALVYPQSTWDLTTRVPITGNVGSPDLVLRVLMQSPRIVDLSLRANVQSAGNQLIPDVVQPVLDILYTHGWNVLGTAKQHNQTYVPQGSLWINWLNTINWSGYSLLSDVNYPLTIDSNALSHGQTTDNNHDPQVCLDYLAAIARYKLAFPSDTRYDTSNAAGFLSIPQMVDHISAQGTGAQAGDFKPQLGASNFGGYSNPKGWIYFSLLNCYEAFQNSPLLTSGQVSNLQQAVLNAAWTYYNSWYFPTVTINGVAYPTGNIYNTGSSKLITTSLSSGVSAGGTTLSFGSAINASGNAPNAGVLTITDATNGNETLTYYNLGFTSTSVSLASPLAHAHPSGTTVTIAAAQMTYNYSPSQNLLCAAALLDAAYRFPSQIVTGMFYSSTNAPQSPALWIQAAQNVIAATLGTPPSSYAPSFNTTYGMFYTQMGVNAGLAPDPYNNTQAKIENNGEVVEALVRLAVLLKNGWYTDIAKRVIDSAFQYIWDNSLGGFFFDFDMGTQAHGNNYKETRSTALMLRGVHAYNQLSSLYAGQEAEIISLLSNKYLLTQGSLGYTYRVTPSFGFYQNSYPPNWSSYLTQAAGAGSTTLVTASGGTGLSGANVMLWLGAGTATEELIDLQYPPAGSGPYTWTVTAAYNNGTGTTRFTHAQNAILQAPPPFNVERGYTTEAMGSTIEHLLFTLTPVDYPAGNGPTTNMQDLSLRVNLQLSPFVRQKDLSVRARLQLPAQTVLENLVLRALISAPTYQVGHDLSLRARLKTTTSHDLSLRGRIGIAGGPRDLSTRVYLTTPAGGAAFVPGVGFLLPHLPILVAGTALPLPFPPPVYGVDGILLPDQPYVATSFSGSAGFLPSGSRLTLFFANASASTQALLAVGTTHQLSIALVEGKTVVLPVQVTATSITQEQNIQSQTGPASLFEVRLLLTGDSPV